MGATFVQFVYDVIGDINILNSLTLRVHPNIVSIRKPLESTIETFHLALLDTFIIDAFHTT